VLSPWELAGGGAPKCADLDFREGLYSGWSLLSLQGENIWEGIKLNSEYPEPRRYFHLFDFKIAMGAADSQIGNGTSDLIELIHDRVDGCFGIGFSCVALGYSLIGFPTGLENAYD
jgi:hypothetical protein